MSSTGLPEQGFGIGTFAQGERVFPALVRPDGSVTDLSDRFRDTHAIFAAWSTAFAMLVEIASTRTRSSPVQALQYADLRPLPPLLHPNVLLAGVNYRTHVVEMMTHTGLDRRDGESDDERRQRAVEWVNRRAAEGRPFIFAGLASAMCGATDDLVLPANDTDVDWELELAVVIGRSARHVPPEEALGLVAGYTIANDVGTPNSAHRDDAGPFRVDLLGKFQPTFLPVGPLIVPAAFVPDPQDLRIALRLNGQTMQDASTSEMIFNVAKLVSYASSKVNVQPGDLLLTGSPSGNGGYWKRFLQPGDIVESEITGLGLQRNRCVAETVPESRTPLWSNIPTPAAAR